MATLMNTMTIKTKNMIDRIGNSFPSQIIPLLNIIAAEWNLKLSHQRDYEIAVRILKNSAKWN